MLFRSGGLALWRPFTHHALHQRHPADPDGRRLLLIITMLSVVVQIALLFAKNVPTALVLHSIYLVSICGIRYAVLKIAIEVTGHEIKNTKIFKILDIIIALDAAFVLSNIFTKELFTIEKVNSLDVGVGGGLDVDVDGVVFFGPRHGLVNAEDGTPSITILNILFFSTFKTVETES